MTKKITLEVELHLIEHWLGDLHTRLLGIYPAIAWRRRVNIRYGGRYGGGMEVRTIEPQMLKHGAEGILLVAQQVTGRTGLRTFRVDRISDWKMTDETFSLLETHEQIAPRKRVRNMCGSGRKR